MARWHRGEQTVRYLVERGRLEDAAPITAADARWAIGKAADAVTGARKLLEASPPGRFG